MTLIRHSPFIVTVYFMRVFENYLLQSFLKKGDIGFFYITFTKKSFQSFVARARIHFYKIAFFIILVSSCNLSINPLKNL